MDKLERKLVEKKKQTKRLKRQKDASWMNDSIKGGLKNHDVKHSHEEKSKYKRTKMNIQSNDVDAHTNLIYCRKLF